MKTLTLTNITATFEDYKLEDKKPQQIDEEIFTPNKNYFEEYLKLKRENKMLRELCKRQQTSLSSSDCSPNFPNECSPDYSDSCSPDYAYCNPD